MMIPGIGVHDKVSEIDQKTDRSADSSSVDILEKKLSSLLSQVEGAGKVDVILTIAAGEEIIYQTNEDQSNSDTSSSNKINTVTVTDAARNQTGLVKQIKTEIYQGAIVVCSGADNLSVRLAIVDAVSRITGLGTNCISVLKMK
jgi:stage III sporulation protein AG